MTDAKKNALFAQNEYAETLNEQPLFSPKQNSNVNIPFRQK